MFNHVLFLKYQVAFTALNVLFYVLCLSLYACILFMLCDCICLWFVHVCIMQGGIKANLCPKHRQTL